MGDTLDLIPEVVVELPTVANEGVVLNEDGTMTVSYEIRPDAMWADGEPITGSDFQFTLETIMDPSLPINKSVYKDIVDFEAGERTFTYTLNLPTLQYELLFDVLIPGAPGLGNRLRGGLERSHVGIGGALRVRGVGVGRSNPLHQERELLEDRRRRQPTPVPRCDRVSLRGRG